jgi:hypothetical protein
MNRTDRLGEEVKMADCGAVHVTAPLFPPSAGQVRDSGVARCPSSAPWGWHAAEQGGQPRSCPAAAYRQG